MKHLCALTLLLLSVDTMANTSPFSAGQTPTFQQLFDNTGTVLNNITNKTGSYYGTRVNGMDIHVTFDCTVDSSKTFPMGFLINAEQNLQYQANFMEPNFGIIQLEYAINDESFRRIAHQGANDMMSSQDHLLKPDRLSRFNLPSGHSILNQVMRDRQQYVQNNQAGHDSHSITIMLPVSAAQDSIAVKLNPFHISWLNAYTTTCQNAI